MGIAKEFLDVIKKANEAKEDLATSIKKTVKPGSKIEVFIAMNNKWISYSTYDVGKPVDDKIIKKVVDAFNDLTDEGDVRVTIDGKKHIET